MQHIKQRQSGLFPWRIGFQGSINLQSQLINCRTNSFILSSLILLIQAFSFSGHCEISQAARDSLKPLQNINRLKANFTQTRHVSKWQTDVKTSGKFQFSRMPHKSVLWEILDPSYMAVRMDDNGLFLKSGKNSTWKSIKSERMAEQMRNIFSWLSFDLAAMEKSFHIKNHKNNEFILSPKQDDSHFEHMHLFLNPDNLVEKIRLNEKNGDYILIEFSTSQVQR